MPARPQLRRHDGREADDDTVNPDRTLQQHDFTSVSPLTDDGPNHLRADDAGELTQRSGGRRGGGAAGTNAGADEKSLDFSLSSNDDYDDNDDDNHGRTGAATGRDPSSPAKEEGKLAEASKAIDERVNDFSERMHNLIAKFQPGTTQRL